MSTFRAIGCCLVTVALSVVLPLTCEASELWKGYVIDQMCAKSHKSDPHPLNFVKNHTRDCALMEACRASGYALYSDGKWFNLDKNGNKLTEKVIAASSKSRGFHVAVQGDLAGNTIKVKDIQEAPEK